VQELLVQNYPLKMKNVLTVLLNGVLGANVLMDQDQDPKLSLKKLLV